MLFERARCSGMPHLYRQDLQRQATAALACVAGLRRARHGRGEVHDGQRFDVPRREVAHAPASDLEIVRSGDGRLAITRNRPQAGAWAVNDAHDVAG